MIVSMTAADLFKWVAWGPGKILEIHGMNNQGATVYIQIHQSPPLTTAGNLANGTIPAIKSLQCLANLPFAFTLPIEFSECFIALSTTEANLTAVAAAGGLDMSLNVDTLYGVTSTTQVKGDLTTGVDSLTVSADSIANTSWRLFRVDYVNGDAAARWLAFVADIAGSTAAIAQTQAGATGSATAQVSWSFGPNGIRGFSVDAARTKHYGIVLIQSSSGTSIQVTSSAASFIRAIYSTT